MENCSREMETVKKNPVEMLEIKGGSEVKNSLEELNGRLATVERRISECQVRSGDMGKNKRKSTEKECGMEHSTRDIGRDVMRSNMCDRNPRWERQREKEAEGFKEMVAGVSPKIDKTNQNIDAGNLLSLKQDKYRENKIILGENLS